MYHIEESWYKGRHPLSFVEHQDLINNHKVLLRRYRKNVEIDFEALTDEFEAFIDFEALTDEFEAFIEKLKAPRRGRLSVDMCL